MKDSELYGVKIQTDRVRTLYAGWDAMAQIEKALNVHLFDIRNLLQIPLTEMRTVAYYMLKHEDKSLRIEKVGAMFSIAELPKLAQTIAQAIQKANSIDVDEDAAPLAPAQSTSPAN